MPSYYWIKLYIEILDDAKMGRLTDRLFRRAIQLFLIAGDHQQEGLLPPTDDIAWRLRPMSADDLETDMADLASVGILNKTDRGWVVTNFAERQAKVPAADRMKQHRDRKRKELYYGDEPSDAPVTTRNTDKNRIDKDKKQIQEGAAAAVSSFHTHSHEPAKLYIEATGQASIPSNQFELAISMLQDVLDHYGDNYEAALTLCKKHFIEWCKTLNKQGRPYQRTNVNWLTKVLEDLAPLPEGSTETIETDEEILERKTKAINNMYQDAPDKAEALIAKTARELRARRLN